jgi:hypothetical protein
MDLKRYYRGGRTEEGKEDDVLSIDSCHYHYSACNLTRPVMSDSMARLESRVSSVSWLEL